MSAVILHPRDEWEWFGTPGHFIGARWCRFHLATKVGPWLVSTVGEYVHPMRSRGSERAEMEWLKRNWPGEDIGCGRKYETMVFAAGDRCSLPECACRMPSISGIEVYMEGYNERGDAARGHLEACELFAGRAAGWEAQP